MRHAPTWVHYAEAQDEAGRVALHAWLTTLPEQPGFVGAELLISPQQPALTLVASRWTEQVSSLAIPEGVRAWTFQVIDSR